MSGATEPLTHIMRTPLPWRDATKTVCGRPASQYRPDLVVPLVDAIAMRQRLGQQRFALVICMTCAHNCSHWVEWDANPVRRMAREMNDSAYGKPDPLVDAELRAIAALIGAHRDEFDRFVAAHIEGAVVTMSELKRRRQTKGRRQ